ncbi:MULTISPECIES: ABC transporter substrate-binding protein [unclassified Streptomyces]|uniref:ABC transporter substrate-binding protein n=1 Tax=unclassified Streptomyces TaxID=2593676 RepID=UPI0016605280|nr:MULTISPECIES: sugar ABC transporter substrate-binding protein [unclassified Streptomyces]MBD0707826.1 sugar ABC transporter substrate-binding protein [Streptomyces sp. CBMA291]MBD0717266.1 sugar ABC transporter substrate-binding protein [Streptomyces sp. CBMA370]
MQIRRGLTTVAAAMSATLLLAACGGGDSKGDKGPVTLRMTVWTSNKPHLKLFNEIAAEYKKTHPEIKDIKFDPLPFETYSTALTTQMTGGNAPDLAWVFETDAADFVSSGALMPLDDTLKQTSGYQYDDLIPSTTKLWENDGKLYAYPFSTSPFGVFVNRDLLQKAGQKTPDQLVKEGKWDWSTVLAEGAEVHRSTGKAGMVIRDFEYKDWGNAASFWGGWKAEPWSADGKTCTFDSKPMVDAMTALHKGIFKDKAMPGPGESADFFTGDAAMTITQISRASLLEGASFKWDLVPLPAGPSGDYSVIGQAGIGVVKQGGHSKEAKDFLAYFTNPQNSAKLAAYFPPPRNSQLTAENLAKTNPLLKNEQLESVVVAGVKKGVVKPGHVGQAELAQRVRAGLDPLWKPDADVKGVLGDLCKNISPLLEK